MCMRANFVNAFHSSQKQHDPTSVKPLRKSRSIKSEASSCGCIQQKGEITRHRLWTLCPTANRRSLPDWFVSSWKRSRSRTTGKISSYYKRTLRDELLVKLRLNIVKQSYPSFTYNQIRFVLACLIRDMEVWLSCALRKKNTWHFKNIKNFGLRFYLNYCYCLSLQ